MNNCFHYFVLLICAASLVDADEFRCDYKKIDSGWYKFHEIKLPFNSARLMCQYEGAILASPITHHHRMRKLMSSYKGTINSFSGKDSSFDGIPLTSHMWTEKETNGNSGGQLCSSINPDGQLSHVNCEEPRSFMCYRKYKDVVVNECGTIDPEYHLSNETKKCYKLHRTSQNFYDANLICIAEGGHLVILNSQTEANVVQRILNQYPNSALSRRDGSPSLYISVGMYDWTGNGDWITITGERLQDAGYSTFAPGEPNRWHGLKEFCGSVTREGLLNDNECEVDFIFICEKHPDYPPVC